MSTSSSRWARWACAWLAAALLHPQLLGAQEQAGYRDRLSADDLGGVIVTVFVPDTLEDVDGASRTMLRSRIGGILAAGGLAGVGVQTPFVMYPLVAVVDDVRSDGGLELRTVARVEVSFVLRHLTSRSVIHQWSGTLTGTGRDRRGAVRDALARISPRDSRLTEFAAESRTRIVEHYERTCDGLRAQAAAAARAGDADGAYAMLLAVPSDARRCQVAAARDAERLAGAANEGSCERQLRTARAAAAAGDDRGAASLAAEVPAGTRCAADADAFLDRLDERARARSDRTVSLQIRTVRQQRVAVARAGSASRRGRERAAAYFNRVDARAIRFDLAH